MPRKAKPKEPKQYFPEVELQAPMAVSGAYYITLKDGHFPLCGGLSREDGERIVALLNDTSTIPTVALKEHLVLSSLRFVEWLSKDDPRSDLNEEYSEEDQAHIGGARAIMDKHKFELPREE